MSDKFKKYGGILRKVGRKVVLPETRIKEVIKSNILDKFELNAVYDFGAGTLFWSEWFSQYANKVFAIDTIYDKKEQVQHNIVKVRNYNEIDFMVDATGKVLWMCDFLHHVPLDFSKQIINHFSKACDFIIIKDIDCNHSIGNIANRIHDRIINGEKIRDISPEVYMDMLHKLGYKCKYYYVPKLWYPHFMIVACKQKLFGGEKIT